MVLAGTYRQNYVSKYGMTQAKREWKKIEVSKKYQTNALPHRCVKYGGNVGCTFIGNNVTKSM